MSITMKDVALESGVNISTVSRALNDGRGVHDATRRHILSIAAKLNYRPNRIARGLATGRSTSLGLIVSDIRNPFFAEVARGAEDAARSAGYDLVLCNGDLDGDKQMQYVRSLMEKRVDGILMNSVSALNRRQQEQLARCGVPIVLLNRAAAPKAFATVHADNEAGGALAAEFLLRLGHRNIMHLTGPRRHGNLTDRERGFVRTLEQKTQRVEAAVMHGENSFYGGFTLASKLLAQQRRVTAIFAGNDLMAFGIIRAILEAGYRIPGDLSVVGFDNLELASVTHPPLTTIHQPKYETGRLAVEVLLRLAGTEKHQALEHKVLDVQLVERQSCRRLSE
jgi:DNA-binding LacI/PurR family transcriptional regulator